MAGKTPRAGSGIAGADIELTGGAFSAHADYRRK